MYDNLGDYIRACFITLAVCGILFGGCAGCGGSWLIHHGWIPTVRVRWGEINGIPGQRKSSGRTWAFNPWVWVVEFESLEE